MNKPNLKISISGKRIPKSWSDLTWQEYESWVKSKENPIKFFSGYDIETLTKYLGEDNVNYFVIEPLSFVLKTPELNPKQKIDLGNHSIQKKIVALNIIDTMKDNIELCFPYLVAVFTQTNEGYSNEVSEQLYNQILSYSFVSVFSLGKNIFEQIVENEKHLESELNDYRIPIESEDRQAGIEALQRFNDIALVLSLANNEFLKMNEAKQRPISEVTAYTIYKQRLSYYEWKKQKLVLDKSRSKLKKR